MISTVWYQYSHTDVIVRRWLEPRPERDEPHGFSPDGTEIASVFLAQRPETDLGVALCEKHDVPVFETIEAALTLGSGKLAVEGVLLIGEHGDYPANDSFQKLYPRKEFFDEIIRVFEKFEKIVPVFCDKHFTWNSSWATEMWETIQNKQIPWLAGSSTSLVGFRHTNQGKVVSPSGVKMVEGVCTFYVGPETYGFHSLEVAQSALENRPGGEAGISAITALVGEDVYSALEKNVIPTDLVDAVLAAEGKTRENLRENLENAVIEAEYLPFNPVAFLVEHSDGVKIWHLCLQGHIENFGASFRMENGDIFAGIADCGDESDFYAHFATLCGQIQKLILTEKSNVPPERTYLTTLTIEQCCQALKNPRIRCKTPSLEIKYP